MERTITSASERIWARVNKTETCWLWTGCLDRKGYGIIGDKLEGRKVSVRVHRLAYETMVGPVSPESQVDHRCHVRHCVNPAHLRLTTHKQNQENRARASRKSKTGVLGVFPAKGRNKYEASISHNGVTRHAGRFDTIAEAEAAVIKLRLELFTHNDLDRVA